MMTEPTHALVDAEWTIRDEHGHAMVVSMRHPIPLDPDEPVRTHVPHFGLPPGSYGFEGALGGWLILEGVVEVGEMRTDPDWNCVCTASYVSARAGG